MPRCSWILSPTPHWQQDGSKQLRKMASPFVPVPVPMDRTLSGGRNKSRRPQRTASLGSVSSSSESPSPVARTTMKEQEQSGSDSRCQSSCTDGTPPPPVQSPVTRARMNGPLEPSVEFSNCPRFVCGSAGGHETEERPITPTVLGYEVMEERAKFTVRSGKIDQFVAMVTNSLITSVKETFCIFKAVFVSSRSTRFWSGRIPTRVGSSFEDMQISQDSTTRSVAKGHKCTPLHERPQGHMKFSLFSDPLSAACFQRASCRF